MNRELQVHITLRAGTFGDAGNTKIIKELPIKARITKTGPPDFGRATVEIKGMKYSDIEQLSTLAFRPMYLANNIVAVYADGNLAFKGCITRAGADFNASPDIVFRMECMSGYYGLTTAQSPTAVAGYQPVEKFIKSQASIMGYEFKNNGVTAQIKNAVFSGSPMTQARQAAKQVGAELILDDDVLILNPTGTGIGNAVKLSKDTGLIGYPIISNEGVEVRSLYNANFRLGGLIQLESIVPKASGNWRVIKLSHDLDNHGAGWFSNLTCFYPSMSGAGGK